MKTATRLALLGTLAASLVLVPTTLTAQNQGRGNRQNRGNFDPAQFQQRMMERYREQLEVKNDDEWKVLESRIQKVLDARRELGGGGMGRAMFTRSARRGGNAGS